MKSPASTAVLSAGLGVVALFAACLDDKNPPLADEAPNRYGIFGDVGSGGGGGGGPADNCECVAAFVVAGSDCAGCIVDALGAQCADQANACTGAGGAAGGGGTSSGGGSAPQSCTDVKNCISSCLGDATCAIACINGTSAGQIQYNDVLTCACAVCSSCTSPGVSCDSGSGGSTSTSTTTTTSP